MAVYSMNISEKPTDDGSCFVKALACIYDYYHYPLKTYDILTMGSTLEAAYEEVNKPFRLHIEEPKIITQKLNELLPIKHYKISCPNMEMAKADLIKLIKEGNPVILEANTYYLKYTKDYLTLPGGLFKSGHATIVVGLDEGQQEFIVSDPTFNVYNYRVSEEELMKAWSYTEGTFFFIPYSYYKFEGVLDGNQINISKKLPQIYLSAIITNVNDFLCEKQEIREDVLYYKGLSGMEKMLDELEKLCDGYTDELNEYIQVVRAAIFHGVRWSRKAFSSFLESNELEYSKDLRKIGKCFFEFYNRWTVVAYRIEREIHRQDCELIKKEINSIRNLLNEEKETVLVLKQIVL